MGEGRAMGEMLEALEGCFLGKYRGVVTDNQDPTGRGRLEVVVPAVMGEEPVWAMPCVPYAGENMGLYAIPEPGTGVWVEFEAGDPSYPVWVGCFWADGEVPANERGAPATPPVKILRSRKGLMVTLDDGKQAVTVSDRDGSNQVTIQVEQGKVTVRGALTVVIEAPQIELVESATHPVVFGDELLRYLNQLMVAYNAHTHAPGSPPAVPLLAATPDLISTRVKSG
jgi:hypothetical protein